MFELRLAVTQFTHIINTNDVLNWSGFIHETAMDNESTMYSLGDGDYYFLVCFSRFYRDTTSVAELELFGDGEKDESEYPFQDWSTRACNPYQFNFGRYVEWMLLLRHIQANVPPGMCYDNILAIDMCH
jgi:hypothetical protein